MAKQSRFTLYGLVAISLTGCALFPPSDSEETESSDAPIEIIEEPMEAVDVIEIETEPAEEPVEDPRKTVSFFAVGDNLIHSQIIRYAETEDGTYDFKPIYENFIEDIESADLAFINQESIIGGDDLGFSGYPAFNTPSDMAENLVDMGFDIVVGSNNHSLDRGSVGVQNTLAYWRELEEEVLFTGVFESQEHRDEIPIVEMNGLTFSILTYTYGTNGILPEAPYQVNYFDPELITNDVVRAQELSDFVIVAAHMGDEHRLSANQMQLDYAQLFADLEVDLMVGSHSHTIQPIEWVTGETGHETLIVYSLGNFLASTTSDINLLGGNLTLDFVAEDEEHFIENVRFEPHLIHYEEEVPGDISTRTNFEIFNLAEYPSELAKQHALNGFEDNTIEVDFFQNIVEDVISEEFLD